MSEITISISNDFSFSYGNDNLFSLKEFDTNLNFYKGEIYAIVGENGCGKTTFLNILNALLKPKQGKVNYFINGDKYEFFFNSGLKDSLRIISNNIRRCFQVPLLVDELNIYNNILIMKRINENERFFSTFSFHSYSCSDLEVNRLLDLVKLDGNIIVNNLSYGQRRIVSNLQAIYSQAPILLLDEPFANLHGDIISILKREYIRLKEEQKSSLIIVEHTLRNLFDFGDHIIRVNNKRVTKES